MLTDEKIEYNYYPVDLGLDWKNLYNSDGNKPADGANKREIFAQNAAPTSNYKEGDLWFDADDNNTIYRANSALSWVSVKDGTIAGKTTTFRQAAIPTSLAAGDLWYDSDDSDKQYRAAAAGATTIAAGAWVRVDVGANPTLIDALATTNAPAEAAATVGAKAGTNLKKSDNTVLADADVITSLGTAALIASQGALATKNAVDLATTEVTNKVAENVKAARNYDAIVDAAGTGDYTTIQGAIDASKTSIFIRKGTYTLSANITLSNGVSLYGEDKIDTIINLNAGNYQLVATGDTPYSAGTISTTNGSATVTGSGTSWSANLAINDYIEFNENIYKITAVTNDTTITIDRNYYGLTQSGISYNAGTFKNNIILENFTIYNQTPSLAGTGVIKFSGVVKSSIKDVIVRDNDVVKSYGIHLLNSYNNVVQSCTILNNGYEGIALVNSNNNIIINCDCNGNGYDGLLVDNSDNNIFSELKCNNNTNTGIYILTGSKNNKFSNISCNNNGDKGIYFVTCNNNHFKNISANNNLYYGIDIGDSYNCTFSNIETNSNGYSGVFIETNSYQNVITSSLISLNSRDGLVISRSSYNAITGNIIKDNSQATNNTYAEILLTDVSAVYSTYNVISGNNIRCNQANKSMYGIRENHASDNFNIVTSNVVQGAITTNISLQGANSVNANNI